jgi:hypothetical protein
MNLDEIMPIPTATRARGAPWPEAARMFIYERVSHASRIAIVIGKSAARVRMVRSKDKWRAFAEQESAARVAERNGLAVPFLLHGQTIARQVEYERDARGERAATLRAELDAVLAAMIVCMDKGDVRYARLVGAAAALRAEIEGTLGLDVARRVGTAAAIARATSAAKRGPNPGRPAWLDRARHAPASVDLDALPPVA